jgi:dolichyl-phosphate beta-glucosyltransferase
MTSSPCPGGVAAIFRIDATAPSPMGSSSSEAEIETLTYARMPSFVVLLLGYGKRTGDPQRGLVQVPRMTVRESVLPVRNPVTAGLPRESEIPTVLLRDPCHLEILIPARDEARRLPNTLTRTIRYLEEQPYSSAVVVIDNGSVDHTTDLVARVRSEKVPVHLTGCARPGKGAAVRRGFLTSQARYVGYMDADLATPIETLDVVEPLLQYCPAVVGSRRVEGAKFAVRQPTHRMLGGMVFRAMAHQVVPGLADTQCGFKFFSGDLARAVARHLQTDGFAFDVELLRRIIEMGLHIKEIPVVWSDAEGSTLRALADGARTATDLLRLARSRWS